jgi:UDP-2,4-diacetamido-2,4,6-trideoxy-beta-L-altropyranose hydrolase
MILRKATSDDALDMWVWRNDPVTREMSKSKDEVPRAAHLSWFASALNDPHRTILIGEVGGEKVGMVRFDHGAGTEVSININPAHRSRGYGYALLLAATRAVPGELWAEIKDQNLASQRLFERVGFRRHSTTGSLGRYFRPAD